LEDVQMSLEKRTAAIVAVLMSAGFLGACNTIEGAGRDIEGAGDAIEDAADREDDDRRRR
jgi:predicted small secreted protein